ncbi:hypothetical protein PBI_TEAMOCIL_95 [Microbacterium phage Teamocil]|uniref:Uncharacterized protein n=1 Tax=Microbacterium phage Teamocil TaxID=2656554 RepID=A0A649VZT6_9CAUD|nr:hypothetical protein QDA12_gp95 [Microbacterium phage Teamocil]QGJ88946.1 hypothetical protein PBI_GINA_95 [Microbacterium phage Gina]QGJ97043.1 hypothetical protein PBI_TEAMOCIL_95 [Microbacterium phage Teamocil]
MTPTIDLIAAELPKHVDLILFEDVDDAGGKCRRDTGGLRCSCGEWQAPSGPYPSILRPRAEFHRHVAAAIQRRIASDTVVETLNAINQRITTRRLGKSIMREMDQDIVTLRSAAAALIVLIGDADV